MGKWQCERARVAQMDPAVFWMEGQVVDSQLQLHV